MEIQHSFDLIEKLNNTDSMQICNELREKEVILVNNIWFVC